MKVRIQGGKRPLYLLALLRRINAEFMGVELPSVFLGGPKFVGLSAKMHFFVTIKVH